MRRSSFPDLLDVAGILLGIAIGMIIVLAAAQMVRDDFVRAGGAEQPTDER